ncbi:hypothetical protein D3C80_1610700 [compost metagenome]
MSVTDEITKICQLNQIRRVKPDRQGWLNSDDCLQFPIVIKGVSMMPLLPLLQLHQDHLARQGISGQTAFINFKPFDVYPIHLISGLALCHNGIYRYRQSIHCFIGYVFQTLRCDQPSFDLIVDHRRAFTISPQLLAVVLFSVGLSLLTSHTSYQGHLHSRY